MSQGLTDNAYTDKQILFKYQTLPVDEDKVSYSLLTGAEYLLVYYN